MSRRIHVRVSPFGEITVEADGFQGKGCEAATKAIEDGQIAALRHWAKGRAREAASRSTPARNSRRMSEAN